MWHHWELNFTGKLSNWLRSVIPSVFGIARLCVNFLPPILTFLCHNLTSQFFGLLVSTGSVLQSCFVDGKDGSSTDAYTFQVSQDNSLNIRIVNHSSIVHRLVVWNIVCIPSWVLLSALWFFLPYYLSSHCIPLFVWFVLPLLLWSTDTHCNRWLDSSYRSVESTFLMLLSSSHLQLSWTFSLRKTSPSVLFLRLEKDGRSSIFCKPCTVVSIGSATWRRFRLAIQAIVGRTLYLPFCF